MDLERQLRGIQRNIEENRHDWQAPDLTIDQRLDRFMRHLEVITQHGGAADYKLLRREIRALLDVAIADGILS